MTEPSAVDLDELCEALDWVSSGESTGMDASAFVDRSTGAIFWVGADDADVLPDGLEDDDRYVSVPSRADLGLGARTALEFARVHLPDNESQVRTMFGHRGAFARFKDLLAARRLLEIWYAFERESTEGALRTWAADMGLRVMSSQTSDGDGR